MRKRWIFILAAVLGAVGIAVKWNRHHREEGLVEPTTTGTISTPAAA